MGSARIPPPTPFVPNPETFLTLIGRNLRQHVAKIPTWKALFSLSGPQLRELGVEPARDRRYLLRWREKFRNGEFGVGGDLKEVVDGVGEVRIIEVEQEAKSAGQATATATLSPGMRKMIVNVRPDSPDPSLSAEEAQPVQLLKVKGARKIKGPHVQPVKGSQGRVARIAVKEVLWEHRRGHKVDGGERRKAEVRAKRKGEERRNAR